MNCMNSDPRLPPELEREIFELLAYNCAPMRYPLLLVARRVFAWIEPTLYETLVFRATNLAVHADTIVNICATERVDDPDFLARHVRRIVFDNASSAMYRLDTYPHTTHIAIAQSHYTAVLVDLLLKVKNIRHLVLYHTTLGEHRRVLPALVHLTHLSLLEPFDTMTAFCSALPALTHLSVHLHGNGDHEWKEFQPLLDLAAPGPRLSQLVILDFIGAKSIPIMALRIPAGLRDSRLVLTYWMDFFEGVVDGYDGEKRENFWDVAARFVREKSAGKHAESHNSMNGQTISGS
ncbi:hypothetical protein MKEN_01504300 [Mycena kentingensis (nom. inval.)]|nr:hypothetical protein MKEN_01504300 [Mycena kentingensis (nom. inval.)]